MIEGTQQEFLERMKVVAKAAALADIRENTARNGFNAMNSIRWAIQVREEHGGCGELRPKERRRELIGVRCPEHGLLRVPEWLDEEAWNKKVKEAMEPEEAGE